MDRSGGGSSVSALPSSWWEFWVERREEARREGSLACRLSPAAGLELLLCRCVEVREVEVRGGGWEKSRFDWLCRLELVSDLGTRVERIDVDLIEGA